MKTQILLLTAVMGSTFLFSCKKADRSTPGIAYQVKTTNRSSALGKANTGSSTTTAREMGGSVNWTSGYASAKEIEFEAQNANGHVEFKSEALTKIDLFSPVSSLGNVTVPPGTYNQVEFQVELVPTATDAAFELKGTYGNTPVLFRVSSPVEIDGDLANVTIANDQAYTSVTALNLAVLMQGITSASLDAATKDANGVIVISASSNTSLYNTMLANLHNTEEEDFH